MDRRSLVDERIKTLLSSTDLTFKQIIEQLKREDIPASFNTIRRVNRNHIFRKPRYDAKLTLQQRKELVVILKRTAKPNLSALAKHFGVCHGSIWYWWDKLTKLREKHNGSIPNNDPSFDIDNDLEQRGFPQSGSLDSLSMPRDRSSAISIGFNDDDDDDNDHLAQNENFLDPESDPLDLSGEDGDNRSETDSAGNGVAHVDKQQYWPDEVDGSKHNPERDDQQQDDPSFFDHHELIGPVQAKDTSGQFINLPILMYASTSYSSPSTSSNSH